MPTYLAAAFDGAPYVRVWAFDTAAGAFGASDDPASDPGSNANGIKFHPTDQYLAVAHESSPFVTVYHFDPTTGSIGAKVPDPSTLPAGEGFMVDWSPDGTFLALSHRFSPFATIYEFDPDAGTFGAKLADPATAIPGLSQDVTFHPSGQYVMVAHFNSPRVSVYNFDPITPAWGSKIANPLTLPGSNAGSARFNPDGDLIVACWGDTVAPEIAAWPFDAGAGAWGARVEPPDVVTNDQMNRALFNADSSQIVVAMNINFGGPRLFGYVFDPATPAFGARIAEATPIPEDNVYDAALTVDFDYVAAGWLPLGGSEGMGVWPFGPAGYGTRIADPADVPLTTVQGIAWSRVASVPPAPPTPGGAAQPLQSSEREALRVLGVARGVATEGPGGALELTLAELLDVLRGTTGSKRYPTDADRLFDLIFAELGIGRPRWVKRNALLALIEENLP